MGTTADPMKKKLKTIAANGIVVAVLTIVLGLVFIFAPLGSGSALCMAIGCLFVIAGAACVIAYFAGDIMAEGPLLLSGIGLVILGALFITKPALILGLFGIIFGAYVVIDAASSLMKALACMKAGVPGAIGLLVSAIVVMIAGCVMLFGPFDSVMLFLGILLLVDGILDLVVLLGFTKRLHGIVNAPAEDEVIDLGEQ